MNLEITHAQANALFPALIDQELPEPETSRLQEHLEGCDTCRTGWEQYARAVDRVRGVPRERAPDALASVILRRARRKPFSVRATLAQAHYRVPYEIVIPLLLAMGVAAVLILGTN